MKSAEQYFSPMVLWIMLYKVVLTFASVRVWTMKTLHMKAIKNYFPVVLFIMQRLRKDVTHHLALWSFELCSIVVVPTPAELSLIRSCLCRILERFFAK